MEPRPQRPRQPQGGQPRNPGQGPGGNPPQPPQQPPHPQQGGQSDFDTQAYPQGYDPGAFVAPPRTDYDYSPLDLAPPGQRRRRQVIAGVIGALAVVLIGVLAVSGWMLLRDDEPADDDNNLVAVATESPVATEDAAAEGTPTVESAPTEDAAAQPTQDVSPTPTPQTEGPVVDTSEAGLTALLPQPAFVPAGFDGGTDSTADVTSVVGAIGGNRQAEQNLTDWGWTANVSRVFNNTAPTDGSTDALLASLHGFADAPSAAAALTYFADFLATTGPTDVEAPALGDSARMLTVTDETGNVQVSLYVQQGPVLYRFWGVASPGGDPTQDVINFATQTLAQ
jgi:hypothetical protein